MVLTIELEKALSQTGSNMQPTKTWSPYRDPLAKFLNKYHQEVSEQAMKCSTCQRSQEMPVLLLQTDCTLPCFMTDK